MSAAETEARAKHTPGPWRIDPEFADTIQNADGTADIAGTVRGRPWEEQAANAALIAAAPSLLAALREVVAISDRKHNAWDKARAAIAKAEAR